VCADEFRLVPSLTLRQEYNDNIFFTSKDAVSDSISTGSAGIEVVHKTEKTDLNLLGRADRRMYWAHSDLDATDQTYNAKLGYALTPKFRVSGRASYIKDSSPDRDIEVTGLVLTTVKRERQAYGGTAEYALTEKTIATVGYDYLKDQYLAAGFVNSESNAANLGFVHDLSYFVNTTKARLNFSAARYTFTGLQIDNASATIGFVKQFAELWSVSLDAGGRYTRSAIEGVTFQFVPPFSFVATPQKEETTGYGWVGHAAVSYRGEKTNAEIGLLYDFLPAYGYAGVAERTGATFNLSRRFTYELRGSLNAIYYLNKAEQGRFSAQTLDQETVQIIPSLRYEPTRDVAVEASYVFTWVRYRDVSEHAVRNLVMVRLILQHAFFE